MNVARLKFALVLAGVVLSLITAGVVVGCSSPLAMSAGAGPVAQIGTLADEDLDEASGVVPSSAHPGIFWTHNDGDDGVLFAVRRDGTTAARFKLDAKVRDWEDIAHDEQGHLFIADIGNNAGKRDVVSILEVAEPDPAGGKRAIPTLRSWRVSYSEKPFDAEALVVHEGKAFVISKYHDGQRAELYCFALTATTKARLEKIATLPIAEPVTSADLSGDGKRLAVLAREALYVFQVDGDLARIGAQKPQRVALPPLKLEGCCFVEDGVLLVAESREILLAHVPAAATQPTAKPSATGASGPSR